MCNSMITFKSITNQDDTCQEDLQAQIQHKRQRSNRDIHNLGYVRLWFNPGRILVYKCPGDLMYTDVF